MKNLRQLLGLCEHIWVRIERVDVVEYAGDKHPIYSKHICKCSKCGAIKKFKV